MKTCTYPGCDRKFIAKGYCSGHYDAQRLGYPMDRANLTPECRFWSFVTKTETCWEWTGAKRPTGYGVLNVGPRKVAAHRFSYELHIGPIPDGKFLDHLCYNRGCVNPSHLAPVTNKQNSENRSGANRNNTSSGVRGVTRHSSGKWQAVFHDAGVRHHVGTFDSVAEAESAVIRARREVMTHTDLGWSA